MREDLFPGTLLIRHTNILVDHESLVKEADDVNVHFLRHLLPSHVLSFHLRYGVPLLLWVLS
jgi:hypothetical protein